MLAQGWSSAMTLESELSTEHFPSMDPATTSWCFDCKRNDRSSRLLKEDGVPALCCEGKSMPCDGNWKDPGSKEQYSSSASKVRAHHCKQGPFQPSCKSCCKAHFTDKLKCGAVIIILHHILKTTAIPDLTQKHLIPTTSILILSVC